LHDKLIECNRDFRPLFLGAPIRLLFELDQLVRDKCAQLFEPGIEI